MKRVVLWIFGISVISLLIGLAIASRQGSFRPEEKDIDLVQSASLANIKAISVESSSANIKISPADSDQVSVHYYGKMYSNGGTEPTVILNKVGNTLNIKSGIPSGKTIGFTNLHDFTLEVALPKSDLSELQVNSKTGDVEINSQSPAKLEASTTTGNIAITNCIGEEKISTTTGDVKITDLTLANNKTIETTTGDINLFLPKDSSFNLQYKTTTGQVSNSLGLIINQVDKRHVTGTLGDGKYTISAETTTGDLIF